MSETRTRTATVAASGLATVTIQPYSAMPWNVTQVSIELSSAPIGATCSLRKNGYLITPMVATGDVASGDPPVLLLPEDVMTVEWVGCTPGTLGKVLYIYEVGE